MLPSAPKALAAARRIGAASVLCGDAGDDVADAAVLHLGEHRVHHQQQPDRDRQADGVDLHPVESVVQVGECPPEDETRLRAMGVAAVYTPKDFDLTAIMGDIVKVAERAALATA